MSMHKFDPSLSTKQGDAPRCAVCGGTELQKQHQVQYIDQYRAALVVAQAAKRAAAVAKRDLVAGRITLVQAVHDIRLGCVPIDAVIAAAPGWSFTSARDLLQNLGIRENKRVDGLTTGQRDRLSEALDMRRAA